MIEITTRSKSYEETLTLGSAFAESLFGKSKPIILSLNGKPDAGKSSFSRGIILGFGYNKAIPRAGCYDTLKYKTSKGSIYHFDVGSVRNVEELHEVGFYTHISQSTLSIIEWAERLKSLKSKADIIITIQRESKGRVINFKSNSQVGCQVLKQFKAIPRLSHG